MLQGGFTPLPKHCKLKILLYSRMLFLSISELDFFCLGRGTEDSRANLPSSFFPSAGPTPRPGPVSGVKMTPLTGWGTTQTPVLLPAPPKVCQHCATT